MSRTTNIFGVISILAGLSLLAAEFVYSLLGSPAGSTTLSTFDYTESVLFFVGAILLVLTSFGLYLYQMDKIGVFGTIAFVIASIGSILMVASDFNSLFARPFMMDAGLYEPSGILMAGFIINYFAYSIGWLLFGISMVIIGKLPRIPAIMLIIGTIIVFFAGDLATKYRLFDLLVWLPWYGSYVWLGIAMLTQKDKQVASEAIVPIVKPSLAAS